MTETVITIWTDGACSGNPGPGGWGAILVAMGDEVEMCGGEADTTNNRMELMAAISAIEAVTAPCIIHVHTDSQYVQNGIKTWLHNWKKNGWRTADKKPVKNADLWKRLDTAALSHQIEWFWVKGHSGNPMNERADALAVKGMAAFKRKK